VHPDDLKQLSDISKFPFTTKQHLRENYPFGMLAVRWTTSSVFMPPAARPASLPSVAYTRGDIQTWSHLMARSNPRGRSRSTDKIPSLMDTGLFTGGLGAHYGGECLGAAVIPVSGGMTERQVQSSLRLPA